MSMRMHAVVFWLSSLALTSVLAVFAVLLFCVPLRSNKRIMTFMVTVCAMAALNALVIPLHLEEQILAHRHASMVLISGHLPEWHDAKALESMSEQLQQKNSSVLLKPMARGSSIVPVSHRLVSWVGYPLRLSPYGRGQQEQQEVQAWAAVGFAGNATGMGGAAAALMGVAWKGGYSAAAGVDAFPGPVWKLPHEAVADLLAYVQLFRGGKNQCTELDRMKRIVRKHHEEVTRVQVRVVVFFMWGV